MISMIRRLETKRMMKVALLRLAYQLAYRGERMLTVSSILMIKYLLQSYVGNPIQR